MKLLKNCWGYNGNVTTQRVEMKYWWILRSTLYILPSFLVAVCGSIKTHQVSRLTLVNALTYRHLQISPVHLRLLRFPSFKTLASITNPTEAVKARNRTDRFHGRWLWCDWYYSYYYLIVRSMWQTCASPVFNSFKNISLKSKPELFFNNYYYCVIAYINIYLFN